jgi:hypothetical protein
MSAESERAREKRARRDGCGMGKKKNLKKKKKKGGVVFMVENRVCPVIDYQQQPLVIAFIYPSSSGTNNPITFLPTSSWISLQ